MHKNRFWERNKNLGIPQGELERMWRILQEKQTMEQMMQAASVAGSGSSSTTPPVGETLSLDLDNIANASLLVANPSSVGDWNTWFGLPGALGQAFTSVEISGNSVLLKGGSGIKIKPDLTYGSPGRDHIIGVADTGCVVGVGGGAFANCAALVSLSLPACLEIYGSPDSSNGLGAFEGSYLYTSPNLPLVTTVGENAFKGCDIISIQNFNSLVTIGDGVFDGCTFLNLSGYSLIAGSVGSQAFNGCTTISAAEFTNPVILGVEAFMGCTAMSTFLAPGLLSAGAAAFKNCTALPSVSFPLLVVAENQLFYGCTSLSSVALSSVMTLGDECFYSAGLSGTYTFNATSIGDSCFLLCMGLQGIYLPQATTIGFQAFRRCDFLANIFLPVCTDLGGSVGNNQVFVGIVNPLYDEFGTPFDIGRDLTVPSALMTCNGGAPDGDIQYLQANNGGYLTITQI